MPLQPKIKTKFEIGDFAYIFDFPKIKQALILDIWIRKNGTTWYIYAWGYETGMIISEGNLLTRKEVKFKLNERIKDIKFHAKKVFTT